MALRLAFHDAGTFSRAAGDGGMNGSIGFELDRCVGGSVTGVCVGGDRVIRCGGRQLVWGASHVVAHDTNRHVLKSSLLTNG